MRRIGSRDYSTCKRRKIEALDNAGENSGVTKLLIHAFIPTPVPTALLTVVTASKQGSGLRTTSKIPVIAEGYGSLLDFNLKPGKTFSHKGEKVGYFEAKCPDRVFRLDVPSSSSETKRRLPASPRRR